MNEEKKVANATSYAKSTKKLISFQSFSYPNDTVSFDIVHYQSYMGERMRMDEVGRKKNERR